jgi:hypothetical protein
MNKERWDKIVQYDLNNPLSEYGFSIRLANENYWTKNFTEKAIVEYKKFMYLAATSDLMVSPSEIVDVVWHQHLIFTQSYKEFCDLAGKQIQHVPSTHNKDDFEKFKQAKERTKKLYNSVFGEQPTDIWDYAGMYESLELDKAKINIRTFILLGILVFVSLTIPAYHLLKPVYVQINNPDFIFDFIMLSIGIFIGLEIYNRQYLSAVVNKIKRTSFVYDLQPLELVYLKTQKLANVINGVVNQLIGSKVIKVNSDYTLEKATENPPKNVEEYQVLDILKRVGKTYYPYLVSILADKPVFWNTTNCMDAFKKYFIKSSKFGRLFYVNFGVLIILLLLGFTRFSTGLLRDKSVGEIGFFLFLLTVVIVIFLRRLTSQVCSGTIPAFYRDEIMTRKKDSHPGQWDYFLFGSSALAASFVSVVNYRNKQDSSGDGSGGSCGSSCGSSCSSCGGCGGD